MFFPHDSSDRGEGRVEHHDRRDIGELMQQFVVCVESWDGASHRFFPFTFLAGGC
jgi:hypothetical protein